MAAARSLLLLLITASTAVLVVAFQPSVAFHRPTRLFAAEDDDDDTVDIGVIRGIKEDEPPIDFGRCGVRLAEDTAVRMAGCVKQKGSNGDAKSEWQTMDNFLKFHVEDDVTAGLAKVGAKIVGSAVGVEDYKFPGESIVKEVAYGPDEAAKAVLTDAGSVVDSSRIVINILSGDDLQTAEVLEAAETITNHLDTKTGAEIIWNSLCYKDFPSGQASIVVVAMDGKKKDAPGEEDNKQASQGPTSGLEVGEVYINDGKYVILSDDDAIEDFTEWVA